LERHALTFGQRLVAVHRDGGEVHEHVVATLTLDEAIALLVRKPLDGAFSQLPTPYWMTTEPVDRRARETYHCHPAVNNPPLRRSRAQRTAFSSRQAIVIGPTPPGTGVRNAATPAASGSTSPTRPLSVRFMPTSTTALPDL